MFVVSEEAATAIRAITSMREAICRQGLELRPLFPGVTNNAQARTCARAIAGLKALPEKPIRFTTHCFTTKYDADTQPAGDPVICDAGGRPRTFCPIRYRLSQRLPALIQGLNHPKAAVMQAAEERNWLHSVTVDDPAGKYHVFFELRRSVPELRHLQDLSPVVESAYPQGAINRPPAVRGSMGFIVLCGKVYKGEPIATRR